MTTLARQQENGARSPVVLFPHRLAAWRRHGLSSRAAGVLANACCDTVDQVAKLGRSYFEARPNCGNRTLDEIGNLAGWPCAKRTAVDAIAAALALSMDPEEAKEAAGDAIIALLRSGFIISARRTEVRT